MTPKSKQKKSTQKYVAEELYHGDCNGVNNFSNTIKIRHQDTTDVRISLLKGQEISSFVINRLRHGVSKNDIPWSKWELWGQVIISVKTFKNDVKRLNIYGKYRNAPGAGTPWAPFRNVTSHPTYLKNIIGVDHINAFNQEVRRLVTANMGESSLNIEDYLVEKCVENNGTLVPVTDSFDEKFDLPVWVHKGTKEKYNPWNFVDRVEYDWDTNKKDEEGLKTLSLHDPYAYVERLAYPGIESLGLSQAPQGMTLALRQKEPIDIIKFLFGTKNYRKDLMKACLKTNDLGKMNFVSSFKGVIPVDWMVQMMNCEEPTSFMQQKSRGRKGGRSFIYSIDPKAAVTIRSLFKSLTETQKRRFINQLCEPKKLREKGRERARQRNTDTTVWIVDDSLRIFRELTKIHNVSWAPGQLPVKSWVELHDYLDEDLRKRETPEEPIPKVTLAKKIEKVAWKDDFSLVTPETTHDLIKWGKEMNHCIGSYTREATSGSSVFVAIMQDNVMIGNAQINVQNKRVVQIFGKRNRILDKEILEKFSTTLITEKVLTHSSFQNSYGFELETAVL